MDELERVSLALTDKIRMIDPTIAELVGIKEAAWMVRDGVGLERSLLLEAMAAKTLTVDTRIKTAELRSRRERRLAEPQMLSSRPGVPPEADRDDRRRAKEALRKIPQDARSDR